MLGTTACYLLFLLPGDSPLPQAGHKPGRPNLQDQSEASVPWQEPLVEACFFSREAWGEGAGGI